MLLNACSEGKATIALRKELYGLLQKNQEKFKAFGIGEAILSEDPGENDFRFTLAYDYSEYHLNELSLFHYFVLNENGPNLDFALNNLGVAYSRLSLPLHAVESYAAAYEKGNTLAANNMARNYLNEGFAEDAGELAKEAMKKENPEPQLSRTLAMIDENLTPERSKAKQLLDGAEDHRRFLASLGQGMLQGPSPLDGLWKFPKYALMLSTSGSVMTGETIVTEPRSPLSGLGSALGSAGPTETKRTIKFVGTVQGNSCKFQIESKRLSEGLMWSLSELTNSDSSFEGFISFSADGKSGKVCEIRNNKPTESYLISKI